MKRFSSSPLAFIFLLWMAFVLACASGNSNNSSESEKDKPVEYKLAFIDSLKEPGYLHDDDVRINRIRFLLNSISERTGDSKETIADWTVRSTQVLHNEYGRDVKNVEFLEQCKNFLDADPKIKLKFEQIATMITMTYAH